MPLVFLVSEFCPSLAIKIPRKNIEEKHIKSCHKKSATFILCRLLVYVNQENNLYTKILFYTSEDIGHCMVRYSICFT